MPFIPFRIVSAVTCAVLLTLMSAPSSANEALSLSLRECIDRALRENLNLKSSWWGLQLQNLSITQAEADFDPSFSLGMTRSRSETPTFYDYYKVNSISSEQSNLNFTLGQSLSLGTDWGVGFYNTLSESNIETAKNYTSNLGIQIDQPLLRGFGKKVNRKNVYLARIASQSAEQELAARATELAFNVQQAYWNLVFTLQTMAVREISLVQADSLLAYNQKGYELGLLTESEVLEAKSAQISRRQEVLDQKKLIRDAEDTLRRLLNMTRDEEWSTPVVPSDEPSVEPSDIGDDSDLSEALVRRPDYLSVQTQMEQYEISFAVSKNTTLPSLNLTARYRLNGSGGTISKNLRDMGDTDEYGWSLGFILSYPLRNRWAKTDYEKQKIELKRAGLALEDLKNQIHAELRSSARNVESSRERIEVAKAAVEVNELKLRKEEERYRNQLSTSYYVLEFQRDLADARNLYNKALLDYMIALGERHRAQGKLLDHFNISIISEEK